LRASPPSSSGVGRRSCANLVDPRACNAVLAVAAALRLPRIVTTDHLPDSPFDHKPTPWRHKVARGSTTRAIVLTQAGRRALLADSIPDSRIRIVANGIGIRELPITKPAAARAAPSASRARVRWSGGWGVSTPQKDPDLLLDALKLVTMMMPGARAVIIGDGSEHARLRALARDMGLDGAVDWIGWRKDAAALLPAMDVLLLRPSTKGCLSSSWKRWRSDFPSSRGRSRESTNSSKTA
jgi:glycosyltransferase involved in cell wall biosynthesis